MKPRRVTTIVPRICSIHVLKKRHRNQTSISGTQRISSRRVTNNRFVWTAIVGGAR